MNVISAIFKRNFLSYFSNPTGYVFICVFVLLGSLAAFWPNEFFNANLANLDQLNKYLPYILLIFIPAITMSIWADERRLGTDELLLTIPASDFQVVLGKYLAAVAIYSVSLLFSLVCNLIVLTALGSRDFSTIQFPDLGLLFATYFGYWIVGLAMLAIGMVASFLTGNLTVSFILGVMFNAPLAFAWAMPGPLSLARWSVSEQFRDFGRGVVALSSVTYFLSLVAVMLYLSMVLIGRRHWRGGADGNSMVWHYLIRFVAAVVIMLSINVFFKNNDRVRFDATSEKLSSLSPQTREIMQKLNSKYPIQIDAFISPDVPENYVQTRLNLISTLSELQALGRDKITVEINNTEPFSKDAQRAEQQYGIRPQSVETRSRGARKQEEVFMGVAFTCGTDKVVVPFFGRGIPVEYEVIRSIATVAQQKRKKIGVLATDAKMFGGFDMQSMSSTPDQMIIEELKKQYEVVPVDPTNPITGNFDVLLAVQPSSLGPQQMENFIAAVKSGQPTAIFEDPFPFPNFYPDVPGTAAPKMPQGGMNPFMMGRQPPQPKGDIKPLWDFLGVDFRGDRVIWQDYNPYPKGSGYFSPEWVFADQGSGAKEPFNIHDPIVSKLHQVLMVYPGAVEPKNATELDFSKLITTSQKTGTVKADEIMERGMMGAPRMNPELSLLEKPTGESYVLAARIQGKAKPKAVPMSDKDAADEVKDDLPAADAQAPAAEPAKKPAAGTAKGEIPHDAIHAGLTKKAAAKSGDAKDDAPPKDRDINVVVVADIDCLYSAFFFLRARGDEIDNDDAIDFDFDNVTFVLNALDALAGDESFVEIRKRRPYHYKLERVSQVTEDAKAKVNEKREAMNKEFTKAKAEEQQKFDDQIATLKKRTGVNPQQALTEIMMAQQTGQRRLEAKTMQLKQERDTEIKKIERAATLEVREQQDKFKLLAVLLPPIPPLLVGLAVFFNRRAKEKEGVSKARLR